MKGIILLTLSLALMSTADDAALQEFTTGNNLFTASIYKEILKENKENFLFSPFSIETVLFLTSTGAKDKTSFEIQEALQLRPDSNEKIISVYNALLPTLKGNDQYALHTANKIYVKNNYPINDGFRDVATNTFQAGVENVDFSLKTEAAQTINQWVEKQTNNKIHDLIDPNSLGPDTRLILINALYFKGKWVYPFESYLTSKQNFYKTSNDVVQVDTMHNTDLYNYCENAELNAKFLELPYEGEDISMVIVLPNEKNGLGALENQLNKVFKVQPFTQERVAVSMPRFAIENKVQLKKILKNLGINNAFSEEADFSGIAGKKGELVISDVLQKAFINVTETGTEAAAATAVGVVTLNLPAPPPPGSLKHFNADHPFMFYLKLKTRGLILFAGKCTEP